MNLKNTSPQSTKSPYLYASQQEAHDDLMLIAREVIHDIVRAGGKPPPPSKMLKDFDRLWEVFRLFAPKEHHDATRTRLENH